MVSKIGGNIFEIMGKYVPSDAECLAFNPKSHSNNVAQNIKYGNVSLLDICPSRISFRGGKVYLSKGKIILAGNSEESKEYFDDCKIYQLNEYSDNKWKSTNYRIFSKDANVCYKNKDHIEDDKKTYDTLNDIINDTSLWVESNTKVTFDIATLDKIRNTDFLGLNHIIGGSHVELLSSNWLAHYMNLVPNNFIDFFGISNPGEFISIKREKCNIDILVEFSNCVVVIENKIKADIVKNSSGYSCQLEKYYDKVENNKIGEKIDYSQKQKKYIILCPDYEKRKIINQIDDIVKTSTAQSKKALQAYEIKTYSELKKCCMKHSSLSYAKYYTDLLDFIDNHSNICEHYKKRKLSEKRFLHNIAINL